MSRHIGLHPKYSFGLLQTPSDSEHKAKGKVHHASSSASIYPSNLSSSSAERPEKDHTPIFPINKLQASTVCSSSVAEYSTSGLLTIPTMKPSTLLLGGATTAGESSPNPSRRKTPHNFAVPRKYPHPSSSVHRKTAQSATTSVTSSPRRRTPLTSTTPRRTPQVTSHTATSSASDVNSSNTLVALVEGRGVARGEIGLCSVDLSAPVLTLTQFSDSQGYAKTLAKLHNLQPAEIILPHTICEMGSTSQLFTQITDTFPSVTITKVQRRYFNENKGLEYVKRHCAVEYTNIELQISTKYYCLATTGALLKYIEYRDNVMFAAKSLKVVFKGCDHTTMIDSATVKNLELLQNLQTPHSQATLYGILNYTKTAGGGRLLRSNILQPPNDEETILLRHNAVAEFTEKEQIFYGLQMVLEKFVDIGKIISVVIQMPKKETVRTAESKLNCVISLKHVLQLVEPLKDGLSYCENKMLKLFWKRLEDSRYGTILDMIGAVIEESTHLEKGALQGRSQRCSAIRPKINGLLDVARRTYTELIDDLQNLVQQLAESHQLPLRVAYSGLRGFYIQMAVEKGEQKQAQDNLPPLFIKVTKYKTTLSFSTMELLQMNERIKSALDQIYQIGNTVITELLADIQPHIACLYDLSDMVALVDMLLSLAHAATLSSYVRPEFTDTLGIKGGHHPILHKVSTDTMVANDTYASEEKNFIILTGPNMGGKSTYLRQVALLQIMAQIGSFVPATFASFRVADQIFSRIGSDDDMASNSSTFTLEMKETNYILQNVTDKSLVIIDELGRGTSAEEGVGICWAICECLIKTKAFTFFVTHFMQLTSLNINNPNVANFHFTVQRVFNAEAQCEKVSYTHLCVEGTTPETHYGLQLASMSTIPGSVIQDARSIASALEDQQQKSHKKDESMQLEHADFHLATKLIQVARNCDHMEDGVLRRYVKSLRTSYLAEVHKIQTSAVSTTSAGEADDDMETD